VNSWKTGVLLSILFLSFAHPSFALERANLLLYVSFERDIMPAVSGGKIGSGSTEIKFLYGTEKDVELVPGVRGTGLKAKPNLSFQYLTRESFSRKEGTIAFWVKPTGWSGLSIGRNFLFVRSDRVSINFYIYPGGLMLFFGIPNKYYLIYPSGDQRDPFRDGEWTFLAGTFRPGEQSFYVNGRFMNTMTEGLLEPEFSRRGIVEIACGNQVLDEIMVFDRVLTEKEIEAVYKANSP